MDLCSNMCSCADAFEYSTVDAEIKGNIDSVLNPAGGVIRADAIGELILEPDKIDTAKTQIVCGQIKKQSAHFDAQNQ